MGRHRRSDAGRAATSRATGGTEPHGSSASDRDPWDPGAEVPRPRDSSPRTPYAQQPRDPYPGERTGAAGGPQANRRPYPGERPYTAERPYPGRRPDGSARPYTAPRPPAGDRPYAGNRATTGIAPYLNPEAHTASDPYARQSPVGRSEEYLFATDDDYARATGTGTGSMPVVGLGPGSGDGSGPGSGSGSGGFDQGDRSHRRKRKGMRPVRTGLLGVSAAVAIGAVAVATGVLPGSDNYKLGGSSGDKVQAADSPTNSETQQGGASGSVDGHDDSGSTSRDTDRATSPAAPTPSASTAAPSKKPVKKASPTPTKSVEPSPTASASEQAPAAKTTTPVTVSAETAAEAEVLRLVNVEREKVGCSAVAANSSLTSLAENFSDAMAAQGFFDHTDPSGATPWDRADAAGITNLGGENIARGQADAAAVMDAWMNSEGHRANILNCDFKTLGVGVHFGTGGPWWTQDFGY